jgi:3-oxoacyl-[acyl-carrier protein] reductase
MSAAAPKRRFERRTVLITGASRGIGAALAEGFAAEGASVVVNYRTRADAAAAVVARCEAHGVAAWAMPADVRDADAVAAMVQEVEALSGGIDALVNNAFSPYRFDPETRARFWETPWSAYQSQFDGAVQAAFHTCQAVLPGMRRRQRGAIVNLISDLVHQPSLAYHDYATAKSALQGFSRNLASELGGLGIRVNCVAPGLVPGTDAARDTREAVRDALIARTPLGRLATPADIVGPVLFLASEDSRFMTGQTLCVDGGLVMA